MSDIISRELEAFRLKDIDGIDNLSVESDTDSDDEDENDGINNKNNYDSDEEFELNNNLDIMDNATLTTNPGIRLFDNVKEELSHAFFKVVINNENKFLHKQAACWLLEKDKYSLSADRLSRVQGR